MKTFAVLVSGFILFVLAAFGAHAATPDVKRVALVIGNSKYVNAVPLPNPANDARLDYRVEPAPKSLDRVAADVNARLGRAPKRARRDRGYGGPSGGAPGTPAKQQRKPVFG